MAGDVAFVLDGIRPTRSNRTLNVDDLTGSGTNF